MQLYKKELINGELFLRMGYFSLEEYSPLKSFFPISATCSKIYQLAVNEKGVFFRERNNDGELSDFVKTSYERIDKELIPLTDYFLNAEYIGLPATINCTDSDYNQRIINGVILYKDPAFLLVYDLEPANPSGKKLPVYVIDKESFVSYVVTGKKTGIYNDPKDLYHDLFIEILETTKDKNSGKQK